MTRTGPSCSPAAFLALLGALAAWLAPARAWAQYERPCSTCAQCTEMLSQPNARVSLSRDLDAQTLGACITVAGEGAVFDGLEHTIRVPNGAGDPGVVVIAADTVVRNIRVSNGPVGIHVKNAANVTVYHASVIGCATGIAVDGADAFRLVRSLIRGGNVGVAFGGVAQGACQRSDRPRSTAGVVETSIVDGAHIGIAACDSVPVVQHNRIYRSDVGLLLGAMGLAPAPEDPCVCSRPVPDLRPGALFMYSSGCESCRMHEGWLPALRRSRHAIVRRASDMRPDQLVTLDRWALRCAPEIVDALGVPGCMPNYACPVSGEVAKVRSGDLDLIRMSIDSSADVARFSESCMREASAHYGTGNTGAACVRHPIRDNVICASASADIRVAEGSPSFQGTGNTCATADRWHDEGKPGCSSPCAAELPTFELPPTRNQGSPGAPPPPPAPPQEPAADAGVPARAPAPVAAPVPAASTDDPWQRKAAFGLTRKALAWLAALLALGLGAVIWTGRGRGG